MWWSWRVTDLQCPARVFVARHGEAAYESPLLSDAGGWLTSLGRQQARGLAESLGDERIARVWTSDMARAVQTGEIVASVLGVDVMVRTGLREFGVGHAAGTDGDPDPFAATFASWLGGDLGARIPGAESGVEVVERYEAVLDEIADSHRGESVLVISHGGVMSMALSALARNLALSHSRDLPMPNCGVVAVEADVDGWIARSWAGSPLKAR
jgi:probable phosphoglycerate mutase